MRGARYYFKAFQGPLYPLKTLNRAQRDVMAGGLLETIAREHDDAKILE